MASLELRWMTALTAMGETQRSGGKGEMRRWRSLLFLLLLSLPPPLASDDQGSFKDRQGSKLAKVAQVEVREEEEGMNKKRCTSRPPTG